MGASLTRGGTIGGRGGSGEATWTRLSLGTLRRDDGDEDLAPRVLAMVILRRWLEVRAAWLRRRGQTESCSGLAPLGYLFEVQMTD